MYANGNKPINVWLGTKQRTRVDNTWQMSRAVKAGFGASGDSGHSGRRQKETRLRGYLARAPRGLQLTLQLRVLQQYLAQQSGRCSTITSWSPVQASFYGFLDMCSMLCPFAKHTMVSAGDLWVSSTLVKQPLTSENVSSTKDDTSRQDMATGCHLGEAGAQLLLALLAGVPHW